jgi:single-strand DNA-binding protein
MFDTYITVVGTALNTPEKKMTKNNAVVTNFRIATHARRFDRGTGEWVDAPNLRIRVACWRKLAENVHGSVFSGDAVVVYGRISTRDWVNEQGEARIAYELDAISVGHDLSRGTASFTRSRPEPAGLVVEDPDNEAGTSVDHDAADASFDDFGLVEGSTDVDALAILAEAGLHVPEPGDEEGEDEEAAAGSGRERRRSRQAVAA